MISNTADSGLEPLQLPDDTVKFMASGQTYIVSLDARLSVNRARWLEKYGMEALLGRTAKAYLYESRRVYDAINASKPADATVILNNMMNGLAGVINRPSPFMLVCALFINREDEDRTTYSEELGLQKIEDWGVCDEEFFKKKALSYLSITNSDFDVLTQVYSTVNLPNLSPTNPI